MANTLMRGTLLIVAPAPKIDLDAPNKANRLFGPAAKTLMRGTLLIVAPSPKIDTPKNGL